MTLLFTLTFLAGLGVLTYAFRDKIEGFLPGFKQYAFSAAVFLSGILDYGVQAAQAYDWSFLGNQKAALVTVAIGGIGMIISAVTKRLKGEPQA